MKYHRHHLRLRALLPALAFLSSSLQAQTAEQQQQQPAAQEKVTHADILRLASSSQPEDRSSAAEKLASHGMDFDLFMKLMTDPNREVRLNTLFALENFCSAPHTALPPEVARQMVALMEQYVTDVCIQTTFAPKDSKDEQDRDISHLCDYALALDTLYQHSTLQGPPESRKHWQERVLKFLVICLAHDRDEHGAAHEAHLYKVLGQITDPYVLHLALQATLERLDDLPADRQLTALEELSAHPLLGTGKPLHLIFLQELSHAWAPVRAHILRNVRHENRRKEAADLLLRIDESFAQLRKQLAPQPATDVQK